MGAIFGYIRFDGQPVSNEQLLTMQGAISYYGPDGKFLWKEGPAALGQLHMINTPEAVDEKFPLIDNEQAVVFISTGRIDNRKELCHLLDIPVPERETIADSRLIFLTYLKYKNQCADYLVGDWSFAAWHKKTSKLFLCRDHCGVMGLYYYCDNKKIIFSTSVKTLLALPEIPKTLNELHLARTLVSFPGNPDQTNYKNIFRLLPAHYLDVCKEKKELFCYWFPENIPDLRLNNTERYVDQFLDIYKEAVSCRLRSHKKTGSTLSSGFDSGSVSALAALELKSRGRILPVFTSVPVFDTKPGTSRYANESLLAYELVSFSGNMEHCIIPSNDVSPLEGIIRSLEIHREPKHAAGNQYWLISMLQEASNKGCSTLLTGQGGNFSVSWPYSSYTEYFRQNNYFKLLTWQQFSSWKSIKQQVIKPLVPVEFRDYLSRKRIGPAPWLKHAAISNEFAGHIRLWEQMKEEQFDPWFGKKSQFKKFENVKSARVRPDMPGHLWHELGSAFGLEVRDPTVDKRLIEFCLSVPDEQYVSANDSRLLIKRAMQGILPEAFIHNKKRGRQAADILFRIHNEINHWQEIAKTLGQDKFVTGYIDVAQITDVLDKLSKNPENTQSTAGMLLTRGIMAGLFLKGFR